MSHICKAKGCDRVVDDDKLMCVRHWRMVPRDVQQKVWSAFLNHGKLTPPHVEAMDAAIKAVATREATR